MQSVPITTNVVSLKPTPVSSTNKTDHHDITEILLKVVLNTITLTLDEKIDRNSKIITKKRSFLSSLIKLNAFV